MLNGRRTLFEPCSNHIKLQESVRDKRSDDYPATGNKEFESDGYDIFIRAPDDDMPGLSVEDRSFLNIMNEHFRRDECGNWSCPLPFRDGRPELQNNYFQVLKRANILDRTLQKDEVKRRHFIDFMNSMLSNGHAEKAPPLQEGEEGWFLPIFGVYHHRKKDKVRVVFDSAAKYGGVSLNDVLLSGPDLTNSLLGIILRFRREQIAAIADIQQMFYCFKVNEEHRNYLRFFWHEDNNIDKPLIEYRMCVHIFGNTASPAIATYGLRLSASHSTLGSDVTDFVMNNFYVDDGLTSQPTVNAAVDLIERTQKVLKSEGNIKLHKIASNHKEVMQAFPSEDLSNDLVNLGLGNQSLPVQHSLGVRWSLESDAFLFNITSRDQPYSRRGVLSTINSIFDPLGFLAPVVIERKLLLRKLISSNNDWDQPLPPEHFNNWNQWTISLSNLQQFQIPRTYLSSSFAQSKDKSVHIFCDASEKAIAAVAYIRARNNSGSKEL